jgi:hypothetical protein
MDRFERFENKIITLKNNEEAMITVKGKKFLIRLATEEQVIMHELQNVKGEWF